MTIRPLVHLAVLLVAALTACQGPAAQPSGSPRSARAEVTADREPSAMAGMLAAHNTARREVGIPALQWDNALATSSRRWAGTLQGQGCRMRHSGGGGVGENLAWASGQRLTPAQVAGMWIDERRNFDPARNDCAPGQVCGHYTQVVWRDTTRVGCAMASCGGSEIWVCQYSPPGNFVGRRPF